MKKIPVETNNDLIQDLFMKFYMMAELIDVPVKHHIQKVGWLSGRIAEKLNMSADFCANIEFSAPLHDIGNVAISDTILKKPYRITQEEKKQIENHTLVGYDILRDSSSEILRMAAIIAKYHHERYNGTGYPEHIAGKDIPLEARIVGVADSLDAIVNKRPYKSGKSVEEGIQEIQRLSGILYDSDITAVLTELTLELHDQYKGD